MNRGTEPIDTMNAAETARLVERIEQHAWMEIFRQAPPDFAAAVRMRAEPIADGGLLVGGRVPGIMFNRALGVGLETAIAPETLDAIVQRFAEAGVRKYAVQPSPTILTDELHEALEARGFLRRDNWVKMVRGTEPAPAVATDLRVERVGPEQAVRFAVTACGGLGVPETMAPWLAAGVGRPGWRHYLAYDNDRPVGTGALYLRDDVAWLGIGSTLPAARRRGAQSAIMARRIDDAIALGCTIIETETREETAEHSNPSYRNMVRTGFRLAYARPNYIRTDP